MAVIPLGAACLIFGRSSQTLAGFCFSQGFGRIQPSSKMWPRGVSAASGAMIRFCKLWRVNVGRYAGTVWFLAGSRSFLKVLGIFLAVLRAGRGQKSSKIKPLGVSELSRSDFEMLRCLRKSVKAINFGVGKHIRQN